MLFQMMFWGLVVVAVLLVLLVVFLLVSSKSRDQLLPRIMAVTSGFAVTGLAVYGGKTIPETLAISLVSANPALPSVWLWGLLVPGLLGLGSSLLLVYLSKRNEELTLRVMGFLATSFIVYSLATIAMASDYVGTVAEHEAVLKEFVAANKYDGQHDAAEAALSELMTHVRVVSGRYQTGLQSLAPNWSFLGATFFYFAFFFRWPQDSGLSRGKDQNERGRAPEQPKH